MSQRRACRLARLSRKAAAYTAKPGNDQMLSDRLKALGEQYPRYGYLMLHAMLKTEGLVVNRMRTYRLYKALGMQVRTKRREKLVRPRIPMAVPTQVNERLSLDFVHDQLTDGRRIRVLNIVDDYSRTGVKLNFIQPGKPTQNAFVESFNARLRDSCLNQHWFKDLAEARRIIYGWKHHYNHERPHSSLDYQAPAVFETKAA